MTRIACIVICLVCTIANAQDSLPSRVADQLDKVFSEISGDPNVVNAVSLVDADGGRLCWSRAAGLANPKLGTKMTLDHQFRTASVTKSFTGTLIMQLVEEGKLQLDSHVHELLRQDDLPKGVTFGELHVLDGKKRGNEITIRQLLNHTSGLADYWFDKGTVGSWKDKSWLDTMLEEQFEGAPQTFDPPTRLWNPRELLQFYFEIGLHERAHFAPGTSFLYSDTNYLLLGMIIEELTGKSLAANYRTRILKPLSITNTYKEYREQTPSGAELAHHFWFIRDRNVDVVDEQLASTGEWANGGQVTSAKDLSVFVRGLFAGKLFREKDTLKQMLGAATIDLSKPQKYFDNGESTYNLYTCGLKRWRRAIRSYGGTPDSGASACSTSQSPT